MPLTKEQLRANLAAARNVIQKDVLEERTSPMAQRAPMREQAGRRGGYNPSGVQYVNTDTELDYTSPYDSDYLNEENDGYYEPEDFQYSAASAKSSRMPDAIKQSMLQEQIDTSSLGEGASILDSVGMPKQQKRAQKRPINEIAGQGAGIDYGMLKKMIMECLDEKLGDSTLKMIKLGDGKIKLVDHSGKIFAATLEYQGNIADKKKK